MPFLCSKHKIYVRIYIRTAIFAHSRVPLKREPSGLLWGSSNKHIHIRRKGTTTTMSSSNKINIYVAHMLCASSVCIQHFMFSALGFLYLFGFLCLLCADAYIYIYAAASLSRILGAHQHIAADGHFGVASAHLRNEQSALRQWWWRWWFCEVYSVSTMWHTYSEICCNVSIFGHARLLEHRNIFSIYIFMVEWEQMVWCLMVRFLSKKD